MNVSEIPVPWRELADDLDAWDGTPAVAVTLCDRLDALQKAEPLRGALPERFADLRAPPDFADFLSLRKPTAPRPGNLLRARLVARQEKSAPATAASASPFAGANRTALLRRLVACDAEHGWALATRAAALAVCLAPDPDSLDYLRVAANLRRRELWTAAMVQLAVGLTGPAAPRLAPLNLEQDTARAAQVRPLKFRHVRALACVVAAVTERPFGGKTAREWVIAEVKHADARGQVRKMAANSDDWSAQAGLCAAVAPLTQDARNRLAQVAALALGSAMDAERPQVSYQHIEAARATLDVLGECEAAWRVLTYAGTQADPVPVVGERLWAAKATCEWLRGTGRTDRLNAMRDGPLGLAPHLADEQWLGAATWLDRLREALGRLDLARIGVIPGPAEAVALVEGLALARAPVAAGLDWPTVAAAVGAQWLQPSIGTVGESAWVDLIAEAAGRRAEFRYLLHRYHVDLPMPKEQAGAGRATPGQPSTDDAQTLATKGLRRLLAARWHTSHSAQRVSVNASGQVADGPHLRQDPDISEQVAHHIVRRLASADVVEATRVLLLVALADGPRKAPARANWIGAVRSGDADPLEASHLLWRAIAHEYETVASGAAAGGLPKHEKQVLDLLDTLAGRGKFRHSGERERYATWLDDSLAVACAYLTDGPGRDDSRAAALIRELAHIRSELGLAWVATSNWVQTAPETTGHLPDDASVDAALAGTGPEATRDWLRGGHVVCLRLANVAARLGGELPPWPTAEAASAPLTDWLRVAATGDVPATEVPMLQESALAVWQNAVGELGALRMHLPWHLAAAVQDAETDLARWVRAAESNLRRRQLLLGRIHHAVADHDERALETALSLAGEATPPTSTAAELLDKHDVELVSRFFLRRLRFDANDRLPARHRLTGRAYYAPLLVAIASGPLTTIQTDYLWRPLIGDPGLQPTGPASSADPKLWLLLGVFFAVGAVVVWQELQSRLGALPLRQIAQRSWVPLLVVLALNYGLNAMVWWIAAENLDVVRTVFLWGTMSLYIGVFFGKLIEGNQVDEGGSAAAQRGGAS